jgi:hypothetical protein
LDRWDQSGFLPLSMLLDWKWSEVPSFDSNSNLYIISSYWVLSVSDDTSTLLWMCSLALQREIGSYFKTSSTGHHGLVWFSIQLQRNKPSFQLVHASLCPTVLSTLY